ncbi:MAG: hypothetical protein M3Q30_19170 [Actinomycetota bacterium]|nr:hypothetical protein [Actinomycetota bacterium]
MTGGEALSVLSRFYCVSADRAGEVRLELVDEPIEGIAVVDGCLVGSEVRVATHAVLVDVEPDGALRGRPVDPLELRDGTLCFDPSQGGVRTRENRRARGAFNRLVAEADRFGMVNAYVHAQRAAQSFNTLLADVGTPPLPVLHVVVGAHFGSKLPGYGCGDGDRRWGALRPLSGGHYRLSTRSTGVPEPLSVEPDGEIHLGPSRYRKPFAAWIAYLRNAAHNPAIVYHEFGHHLCRHTADFRLNAERAPGKQRNGKTGIEEGVCDYFAAVLLGSGRPYGWYRADRGRRRDPELPRHASERDGRSDAHAVGATWAGAWWRCRRELVAQGHLRAEVDHDRTLARALLAVGEVGRGGKRRTRTDREAQRSSPNTMLSAYLAAVREAAGPSGAGTAAAIIEQHGLLDDCEHQEPTRC